MAEYIKERRINVKDFNVSIFFILWVCAPAARQVSGICRVRLCCGLFADGCDSRGALVYEVGAEEAATRSRRGGGIPAGAGRLDQNLG